MSISLKKQTFFKMSAIWMPYPCPMSQDSRLSGTQSIMVSLLYHWRLPVAVRTGVISVRNVYFGTAQVKLQMSIVKNQLIMS